MTLNKENFMNWWNRLAKNQYENFDSFHSPHEFDMIISSAIENDGAYTMSRSDSKNGQEFEYTIKDNR
jgi:hypothetical protein